MFDGTGCHPHLAWQFPRRRLALSGLRGSQRTSQWPCISHRYHSRLVAAGSWQTLRFCISVHVRAVFRLTGKAAGMLRPPLAVIVHGHECVYAIQVARSMCGPCCAGRGIWRGGGLGDCASRCGTSKQITAGTRSRPRLKGAWERKEECLPAQTNHRAPQSDHI